ENHADAWFIGYVPQLSTAVWVGYPDSLVPMTDVGGIAVSGGTYPARIFARYMKPALANVDVQDLFTASPDDLSLHRLDVTPTMPTTSTPSSSSTSSTTTTPPAVIDRQSQLPSPQPASPEDNKPPPYRLPAPTTPPTEPPEPAAHV